MHEIILKANIDECVVEGWESNTGEVAVRTLKVDLCEDMLGCDMSIVTFKKSDGTVEESRVINGKANIPQFETAELVGIGVYSADIKYGECKKRYSPRPTFVYVGGGSYSGNGTEPPIPTAGDYEQLLNDLKEKEDVSNKVDEIAHDETGSKYPTVNAISNYIKVLPAGELDVTENFSDIEVYNANAINIALNQMIQYIDEAIGGIENGSY